MLIESRIGSDLTPFTDVDFGEMTVFVGCAHKFEHVRHCQSDNLLVNQAVCVTLLTAP